MPSLGSSISSADASGAFALLAVASDTEATKARLKELTDLFASIDAARNETQQAAQAAAIDRKAAEKALTDVTFRSDELRAATENNRSEAARTTAELQQRADTLATQEQRFAKSSKAKADALTTKERDLTARETKLVAAEAANAGDRTHIDAMLSEYESKVAAIRAFAAKLASPQPMHQE